MGWVRFEDNFPRHPKIIGLSDHAFRLFVEAVCYCNEHLTDGVLPAAFWKDHNGSFDELKMAGCLDPHGSLWKIHDYHDYQPTAEFVRMQRKETHAAKVKAGIAGAKARWQRDGSVPSPLPLPLPSPCQAPGIAEAWQKDGPNPIPGPIPVEKRKSTRQRRPASVAGFDEFWKIYPRKKGREDALRLWKNMIPEEQGCALAAVKEFAAIFAAAPPDRRQFIPHGDRWLRGKRWLDDRAEWERDAGRTASPESGYKDSKEVLINPPEEEL